MRFVPLLTVLLVGCGNSGPIETPAPACDGIAMEVLDDAIAPPANIGAVVRVTDCSGEPLGTALTADSFELSEDGSVLSPFEARRLVERAQRDAEEMTIVALDLSGSISAAGLKPTMIEGARRLVRALGPEHRIALFGFDGRPDLVPYASFTTDHQLLEKALDQIAGAATVDDSTNLNGAIVSALEVLDQAVGSRNKDPSTIAHGTLVLFTDGRDRASRVSTPAALAAIERTRHSVLAIGVGAEIDADLLSSIGRTGSFLAEDASGVATAFVEVAHRLTALASRDYLVSYCSPARAGEHTLEMRVRDGKRTGIATIDFIADGFGAGCAPETTPLR